MKKVLIASVSGVALLGLAACSDTDGTTTQSVPDQNPMTEQPAQPAAPPVDAPAPEQPAQPDPSDLPPPPAD